MGFRQLLVYDNDSPSKTQLLLDLHCSKFISSIGPTKETPSSPGSSVPPGREQCFPHAGLLQLHPGGAANAPLQFICFKDLTPQIPFTTPFTWLYNEDHGTDLGSQMTDAVFTSQALFSFPINPIGLLEGFYSDRFMFTHLATHQPSSPAGKMLR